MFKKIMNASLLICLSSMSNFVLAGTNDIEQKVLQLEKESAAQRLEIERLKKQIENDGRVSSNPDATNLEKKIKDVDLKAKARYAALKRSLEKEQERLTFNGFLSAGLVQSNRDVEFLNFGFKEQASFRTDAIVGVQTTYRIAEKTSATVQMVANGVDNFTVEAVWGYVSYNANDNLKYRAGRMKLPLYLISESLDIGFTYPYVRPPIELYVTPLSSFEGMDLLYRFYAGNWINELQFGIGTFERANFGNGISIVGEDAIVSNITSTNGPWTLRLSYNQTNLDVQVEGLTSADLAALGVEAKNKTPFINAGLIYDDGEWLVLSEFVDLAPKSGAVNAENKMYATVGRRIDQWLPYVTFARLYTTSNTDDDARRVPIFTIYEGNSYSVGVRKDISSSIAAKCEINYFTDFEDTQGPFNSDPGAESVTIYTFLIDAVF